MSRTALHRVFFLTLASVLGTIAFYAIAAGLVGDFTRDGDRNHWTLAAANLIVLVIAALATWLARVAFLRAHSD